MGFRRLVVAPSSPTTGTGISATLSKRGAKPARLGLTISTSTAAILGLEDGMLIEVLQGTEESHGLLRLALLAPGSDGGMVLKKTIGTKGSWFRLALGVVPEFVDRAEPRKWCQWEKLDGDADEGFVEIVLPSWASDTRPGRRDVVMAQVPLAATKPRAEPQRAIAISGDPPAGRSALDRKGISAIDDLCSRYGLTPAEGRLLSALAKAPIVSRSDLERAVWDEEPTDSTKLATLLNLLRGKIGAIGFEIINSRGIGWGLNKEAAATVRVAMGEESA